MLFCVIAPARNAKPGGNAVETLRVSLAADDPLSADGAASALRGRSDVEILPAHRRAEADVVVLVVLGGETDLLDMMRSCAGERSGVPRVVLVTDRLAERQLIRAVELGLVSVLSRREASPARVLQAVQGAADHRSEMPPELLNGLLEQVRVLQREVLAPNGLTVGGLQEREVEVLRLLADGLDTLEIAGRLNYSERTVKNVLHGMMSRLKLRNRSHAVAFGLRCGAV